MPSSTSSSEVRESAVAQRRVVKARWGVAWLLAAALIVATVAVWELHWRGRGYGADVANSAGLWNLERRKVTADDGRGTAIVGSSRVFFDLDLETWAQVTGGPVPVMLALEGTPPWSALDDLAADPGFRGFLVVGYTPNLFFGGFPGERGNVPRQWREESPSQRFGQLLSMQLETRLAFLDGDAALGTLIRRPWPVRAGLPPSMPPVPRLAEMRPSREQIMWSRLETDAVYRERARGVWSAFMGIPMPPPSEEDIAARIASTKAAIDAIRARGGEVLFVRCPSAGKFREHERATRPRELFWDRLLRETSTTGIHFEDHAELQGFDPPEWSHLRAADRIPFTRGVAALAKPVYDRWRGAAGGGNLADRGME